MKKFICTIPLQINNRALEKVVYDAMDNKKLEYQEAVSFPIIPVINGYVNDGEEIELLVLKQKAGKMHQSIHIGILITGF